MTYLNRKRQVGKYADSGQIIAVLHNNDHDGVIHACVFKSLYFIKVQ